MPTPSAPAPRAPPYRPAARHTLCANKGAACRRTPRRRPPRSFSAQAAQRGRPLPAALLASILDSSGSASSAAGGARAGRLREKQTSRLAAADGAFIAPAFAYKSGGGWRGACPRAGAFPCRAAGHRLVLALIRRARQQASPPHQQCPAAIGRAERARSLPRVAHSYTKTRASPQASPRRYWRVDLRQLPDQDQWRRGGRSRGEARAVEQLLATLGRLSWAARSTAAPTSQRPRRRQRLAL
jgi:hypothetical protein